MAELPPPPEGIVLAHFIVSDDVERSRRFYTEVLGGRVAFSGPGGLTYVALSNSWVIFNGGGGPTDDKPSVTLETPRDPDRVSSFLNIRGVLSLLASPVRLKDDQPSPIGGGYEVCIADLSQVG